MTMTPEQAARELDPAALLDEVRTAMERSTRLAEAAIKRRSRVRRGLLRRSWTGNVLGHGDSLRGIVASNVVYAPFQKNDPVREGYNDVKDQITHEFDQAGVKFGARFQ